MLFLVSSIVMYLISKDYGTNVKYSRASDLAKPFLEEILRELKSTREMSSSACSEQHVCTLKTL